MRENELKSRNYTEQKIHDSNRDNVAMQKRDLLLV